MARSGAARKRNRRMEGKEKTARLLTAAELAAMGDIEPCELVRGRIVWASPAKPPHGKCASNFAWEIRSFAQPRALGRVYVGEVGVFTEHDPDTVRGADVLFVGKEGSARVDEAEFLETADLVVEVVSQTKLRARVIAKLPEYFAVGVRLVWVADCARRTVTAYRSPADVRVFKSGDFLPGDDVLPGFSVPVGRLFD